MGVFTHTYEDISQIPPARLFKALILDSHNLLPKLLPQLIKSMEFIQGDGGVGSIRQVTYHEGHQAKCTKSRIDTMDVEKCLYTYTMIEGDGLLDNGEIESIVYEVEFVEGAEGGSINKMKSTYTTKGEVVVSEEAAKAGKEKALAMYKVVEAYLLQNPEAYV